jgi:hypothetical protein
MSASLPGFELVSGSPRPALGSGHAIDGQPTVALVELRSPHADTQIFRDFAPPREFSGIGHGRRASRIQYYQTLVLSGISAESLRKFAHLFA